MGFIIYDLILLGIFILFVVLFLTSKKKNLQRQGIIYLYRTKIGIKFIDHFSKRFEKILKPSRYVVVACGYVLLVGIMWLLIRTTWLYLTTSISQIIKAPRPG